MALYAEQICLKLTPSELARLDDLVRQAQSTRSEILREALRQVDAVDQPAARPRLRLLEEREKPPVTAA